MSLVDVLERARALGFLGPGPVERHLTNAEAFAAAVGEPPARLLDLGSGAGVPGLALAVRWPEANVVLLDAHGKRTTFLSGVVEELGLAPRVEVRTARAEDAGRNPGLRATFDVVTARSFGSPAATAECGAPLLQVNGLLVVAEPPGGGPEDRWPTAGLRQLGLADEGIVQVGEATVRRLRAVQALGDEYPRPNGVPGKRPLF